jgi:hypothetical protein
MLYFDVRGDVLVIRGIVGEEWKWYEGLIVLREGVRFKVFLWKDLSSS